MCLFRFILALILSYLRHFSHWFQLIELTKMIASTHVHCWCLRLTLSSQSRPTSVTGLKDCTRTVSVISLWSHRQTCPSGTVTAAFFSSIIVAVICVIFDWESVPVILDVCVNLGIVGTVLRFLRILDYLFWAFMFDLTGSSFKVFLN